MTPSKKEGAAPLRLRRCDPEGISGKRAAEKRFLRNRRGARPANTGGASSDAP